MSGQASDIKKFKLIKIDASHFGPKYSNILVKYSKILVKYTEFILNKIAISDTGWGHICIVRVHNIIMLRYGSSLYRSPAVYGRLQSRDRDGPVQLLGNAML